MIKILFCCLLMLLCLCPVACLSLEKLNWDSQKGRGSVRTQTKISIGPIFFLYYEESLVSSNLNSKQLRFHVAHPNEYTLRFLFICTGPIIRTVLISGGLYCSFSFLHYSSYYRISSYSFLPWIVFTLPLLNNCRKYYQINKTQIAKWDPFLSKIS